MTNIIYSLGEPTPKENVRNSDFIACIDFWYSGTYFSYVNDEYLIFYWGKVNEKMRSFAALK